jgi:signal transduction histidine kinase
VEQLADRSAIPVRVAFDVESRPPAEVEATAYFFVSEGLANAAKHSGASVVRVGLTRRGDRLAIDVIDDGGGGAEVRTGSGLEGLADRLATLGARLEVDSGPSGTRIATVIPCA